MAHMAGRGVSIPHKIGVLTPKKGILGKIFK